MIRSMSVFFVIQIVAAVGLAPRHRAASARVAGNVGDETGARRDPTFLGFDTDFADRVVALA